MTRVGEIQPDWVSEFATRELKQRNRTRLLRFIDRFLLFALLIVAWQVAVSAGWVRTLFVSSPELISKDLWDLLQDGSFYNDIRVTLSNALVGLLLGVVTGVFLALVVVMSPRLDSAAQPLLVAFNSLPRIALAPLFVVWLGFGPSPKILLALFTVFFLVFFNVVSGIKAVDRSLLWNFKILKLSRLVLIRRLYLPSAAIWVLAAMKNAISLAVTAAVVAEFVGARAGLGYQMTQAISFLNTTRMFSVLVVLMAIGLGLFSFVTYIEQKLDVWR